MHVFVGLCVIVRLSMCGKHEKSVRWFVHLNSNLLVMWQSCGFCTEKDLLQLLLSIRYEPADVETRVK